MLGFLWSLRPARTVKHRLRRPLTLEMLETRVCPAGDMGPHLLLDAQVLPGHYAQLSGQVFGDAPAGATVSFSGAVVGQVTADEEGFYSFTTDSATLGVVYAVGLFSDQTTTDTASAELAIGDPTVTLAITDMTAETVTLTGTLTDLDQAEQTITISGAPLGSVVTDSAGYFSFTLNRTGLSTLEVSATNLWGASSNTADVYVDNPAPTISDFSAFYDENVNLWTFQGFVTGSFVDGLTVTLGGISSLSGETAIVDASGWFTFSKALPADEAGTATAQTTQFGLDSNIIFASVDNTAPSISDFTAFYDDSLNAWTFQGYVTGSAVEGLTVTLGGIASLNGETATVDASGWFTFSKALAAGEFGTATAVTTQFGLESNTPTAAVANIAPVITNFSACFDEYLNFWTFTGTVTGDNVEGLIVTFDGLWSLIGESATVGADGTFSFTKNLAASEFGTATAEVTQYGLESNVATCAVL